MAEKKEDDFRLNRIFIIYDPVLESYQPLWVYWITHGNIETSRLNFNADIMFLLVGKDLL